MKTTMLLLAMLCSYQFGFSQTDSVKVTRNNDTIAIGGIIILKKSKPEEKNRVMVTVGRPHENKSRSAITTHSMFFDLGISNWVDNTNYADAAAANDLVSRPGSPSISSKDFALRTGKSINVNIWLVGQRVNLVKHQLNLKYALGLELNNYRFKTNNSFSEGGFNPYNPSQDITHPFMFTDSVNFSKDKLVANYLTIPLMLDFRSNPRYYNKGVSLSAGVSLGYLYGSRTKQKSSERGKQKNKGDFDLEKWKFAYVGEIGIGSIHLYGSYSPKSIFKNEINLQPYTIGLRFSSW